jgi:hypothetical protein
MVTLTWLILDLIVELLLGKVPEEYRLPSTFQMVGLGCGALGSTEVG